MEDVETGNAPTAAITREELMLPLDALRVDETKEEQGVLHSQRSLLSSLHGVSICDAGEERKVEEKDEETGQKSLVVSTEPVPTPEPVSYCYETESFKELFRTSATAKAFERIRKEISSNADFNSELVRFVIDGPQAFNNHLIYSWHAISIVATFMAIVSATIAVGFTGHFAGISGTGVVSTDTLHHTGRSFFVLWAVTALLNVTVVIVHLLAQSQYSLMLHDDDMVWFVITWGWWTVTLPKLLFVLGVLTAIAGLVVGVALVADLLVASVVAGVSGLLLLFMACLYATMLSFNKEKEQEALAAIRRVMLKHA